MPTFGIMKKIFVLVGFIGIIPFAFCVAQTKELKKFSFLPLWFPQQQFAGYYMAKEKGIYEKHGLDVSILNGGNTQDVTGSLKNGAIDFGILFLYTGVKERSEGTKLVNIGQIFQRSDIMFVAKKKSGITTLKDFNGRKIGLWRTVCTELTAGFLKKHNINARIVPFDNGISVLLKDAVDVIIMMNYNEYKQLLNSGVNADELTIFKFYDYGMNFPEDGIYCMESTYIKDPDACKQFVEASIEGWRYALAHREETIAVIGRYKKDAKVPFNLPHSRWMLNSMHDMIYASGKKIHEGTLLEKDFDNVAKFLYNNKFISNMPLYEEFYKGNR